jgi:hypothetical protein
LMKNKNIQIWELESSRSVLLMEETGTGVPEENHRPALSH